MNIASRLKAVRESLELSQRDMAKKLEISLGGLQSYESGKSVPGGNVLESLARLGFNVDWLLTGKGEMTREERHQVPRSENRPDELLVNVVQAAIETAGKVDAVTAKRYAHAVIDVVSLIAELRSDLPDVAEIKGMFAVIMMLDEQIESGVLKFKRDDIGKIINVVIKGS